GGHSLLTRANAAPRYTPAVWALLSFPRSPPRFVDYARPELRNPGDSGGGGDQGPGVPGREPGLASEVAPQDDQGGGGSERIDEQGGGPGEPGGECGGLDGEGG